MRWRFQVISGGTGGQILQFFGTSTAAETAI
jgi:hypothetical protein